MKIFIDNQLIRKIENSKHSLFQKIIKEEDLKNDQQMDLHYNWPTFLEVLGLSRLFEKFFVFDEQNPLFIAIISALTSNLQKEALLDLYDQLFVEGLAEIKNFPEIQSVFLLNQIYIKKKLFLSSDKPVERELFLKFLEHYEKLILENSSNTLHDLILYLGWDRVCVNLSRVFEYIFEDSKIVNNLLIFKECLIESFQHITATGRTLPSFFRFMEALYAFEMRPENLETHSDEEWAIFCAGATALRPREQIADVFYIDAALTNKSQLEKSTSKIFTLESSDEVKATLSLAHLLIKKIKESEPSWNYTLQTIETIYCLHSNLTY